jgi:hypothetical protein
MSEKILYICATGEVSTLSTNIELALANGDWSDDVTLTKIFNQLKEENEVFRATLAASKSGEHTIILKDLDEIADRTFLSVKYMLWANTFNVELEEAEDARFLYHKVFAQHNINLHRQSYENQMAFSAGLADHMKDPKLKAKMDSLTGVSKRFLKFEEAAVNFRTKFNEFKKEEAKIKDMISPSSQKAVLRNLINNQLLVYLNGVVIGMPEKYGEILREIEKHIESANTKARARKTLSENQEEIEEVSQ